jgi:hypothetical protein
MLLQARMLQDVANVNCFRPVDTVSFTEGDVASFYFVLIDSSLDKDLRPAGRRFMPAVGATLQVVLHNINDAKTVTRYATNPFPTDTSIWKIDMLSTDSIKGSVGMKLILTQGTAVTRGFADNVLTIYGQTQAR